MNLTIAICTRNRANSLAATLASLAEAERPAESRWEVIVVDNGSTDHTPRVLADYASILPIAHESEPRRGLSRARNRAVAASSGDYILWIDDDVIVDRSWLSEYAEAFRRFPDASVFGGPIRPVFTPPTPAWLAEGWTAVAKAYAARDFGPQEVRLDWEDGKVPYGANYAVRAAEQRLHPYDEKLGAGSDRGLLGEETSVLTALMRNGSYGIWVPRAGVAHVMPASRQTVAYLRRYFEAGGRTDAHALLLNGSGTVKGPAFRGVPRWLWRRRVENELRYLARRWTSRPSEWLAALAARHADRGMMRYLTESKMNRGYGRT
jgi:glycosyltransferase involved in cell wall biosynthesis